MNTLQFLTEKLLSFGGPSGFACPPPGMTAGYVVYDCDIGTDDAWGLLMLIKGEQLGAGTPTTPNYCGPRKYKILGVTCVHGNTDVDNVAKNALRVLQSADRNDIPVFKGCGLPILPRNWQRKRYFHGIDGFGDLQHDDEVDVSRIRSEHAVNAMYEFACKYPKQVDYVLVGPLTNFAMCINMYGDQFLDKVRHIYVMGGNYRGKGNITKSAEFNFMMDPEAAHIVLEYVKPNPPLVILPWETCIDGDMGLTQEWRFKELAAGKSKGVALLNRVEQAVLVPKGLVNWIVCDAMLVAAYIFPQVVGNVRGYYTTVELTGTHTRGQMVLDHLREKADNAWIIMEIHKACYKQIISWTAGVEGVQAPSN